MRNNIILSQDTFLFFKGDTYHVIMRKQSHNNKKQLRYFSPCGDSVPLYKAE